MTGQKFHSLTVISRSENLKDRVAWNCICDCGEKTVVRGCDLVSGNTKSCGHNLSDKSITKKKKNTDDKLSNGRIIRIYHNMKQRCLNQNHYQYMDYGGRGIKIVKSWLGDNGLVNFYNWAIRSGYSDHLTIDRINVNKGYSPDNCRWATSETQANNRRTTKYLTIFNERKTVSQWSKHLNIPSCELRKLLSFPKKITKSITKIEYIENKMKIEINV